MSKLPSARKILQALYQIQSNAPQNNPDRFNKVYLLKMIYFADRYHLRHFGNLATEDCYVAMKLGPVASTTYDILKKVPYNINSAEIGYLSAVKELSEYDVEIAIQDNDELSESFNRSLNFASKEFGHFDWKKQSDISHFYPEWKKHEPHLSNANPGIPMDVRDFFDDPGDEACFLMFGKKCDPFKEDKKFLALLKEDFDENPISV